MTAQATGRGKIVVVAAPSGSGKTSIAREILLRYPSFRFSVSATTRPKRPTETHGKDYFFLERAEFEKRVAAGEFVEWETIYGNLYGTLKCEVDTALVQGSHLMFDVDVKGALSIKRAYPEACLIFIRPPSVEILEQRLRERHTENAETLRQRMERVPMELDQAQLFDHQVVNDVLSKATDEVDAIVKQHIQQS
jgi:guanylate kinase